MDVLQWLILGLSGLSGVGGGTAFVPALVYVAGWEIGEAAASGS